MKVLVAGAGPAGLYFSYLARRAHPDWRIRVLEQNPPDATFGFGVVFSDKALEFLRADDAETYGAITPELEAWVDLVVVHRGVSIGRWAVAAWDSQRFLAPYAVQFVDELVAHCRRGYPGHEFSRRAPPLPRPRETIG